MAQDLTHEDEAQRPVTWRRAALAVYIDFWIASLAPVAFAAQFVSWPGPVFVAMAFGIAALFSFVPVLRPYSPGRWLLSVSPEGDVPDDIRLRSNWMLLIVGMLFLFSGVGALTPFGSASAGIPDFGFAPTHVIVPVLAAAWGCLLTATGGLLLRLRRIGADLGMVACGISLVSLLAQGSELWRIRAENALRGREEIRNLPQYDPELLGGFGSGMYYGAIILSIILLMMLLSQRSKLN